MMNMIKHSPIVLGLLFLLAGCGSDSGSDVQQNVDPNQEPPAATYDGPAPQTDDVQQFKLSVWDPLAVENRCGSCHGTGGQEPTFVRADDINLAYADINDYIDLEQPANSRLVTKVAEGHNCWQASADACADIIEGYVEAWASASGSVSTRVVFEAPDDQAVGSSKIMPAEPGAFASTVYPLLTEYCSECHTRSAPTAQQPYLGSSSVSLSFEAARTRMRLDDPADSRLVQRLGNEGHNCWSDDCQSDANAMTAAITEFADSIAETEIDPDLVVSRALSLGNGIVASSGGRVDTHIIAKYEFKTGQGPIAYDTSGVEPAANLNLSGDVQWMSSWGLRLNSSGNDGKAQAATSGSRKLHDLLTATGEYSIEAWVIPDNVTQGDGGADTARIVSYSGSNDVRNFTLGQTLYNYDFLNRSSETDVNGLPALSTNDADERLQATLQHVVATFDPVNGRRLYVNGEFTNDEDPLAGAALEEWSETFALVLGNEVSGSDYAWSGSLRFLAIHNRSLAPEAIRANFDVGVGARFYLLFNISELIDVDGAYVAFEVQQFDDYGYLFAEPFFLTLGDGVTVPPTPIKGIRIGVNGREAPTGQVFAALDTELSSEAFVEGRQPLSGQGAVIELQQGPDSDQFFLTFDRLGEHEFVRVESEPPAPGSPPVIEDQPRLGLRSFAAINATLSTATGIPATTASVVGTYEKVRQQLPTAPQVDGFVAAHQMGVTQLAVAYCSALTADSDKRSDYYAGFDFSAGVSGAFDTDGRSAVIEPLLKHLLAAEIEGQPLASQADPVVLRTEMNDLIDLMAVSGGDAERSRTIVTALCAATLGSALTLVQ
ncbi:LamG domain-containing protein [Marinimicrobium koreense]|nr:LamG domain-containing protein [Marinimicrobium koreense]